MISTYYRPKLDLIIRSVSRSVNDKGQKGCAGSRMKQYTSRELTQSVPCSMLSLSGNGDLDAAVRETDTDAAVARLSAAQKHYVQDPFIKHLVPRAQLQPPRPPLINIGTFVRSTAIDELIEQWLLLSDRAGQRCQIVSLGAGSDTRFWRIAVCLLDSFQTYLYGRRSARQACIRTYSQTMWRLISRK